MRAAAEKEERIYGEIRIYHRYAAHRPAWLTKEEKRGIIEKIAKMEISMDRAFPKTRTMFGLVLRKAFEKAVKSPLFLLNLRLLSQKLSLCAFWESLDIYEQNGHKLVNSDMFLGLNLVPNNTIQCTPYFDVYIRKNNHFVENRMAL